MKQLLITILLSTFSIGSVFCMQHKFSDTQLQELAQLITPTQAESFIAIQKKQDKSILAKAAYYKNNIETILNSVKQNLQQVEFKDLPVEILRKIHLATLLLEIAGDDLISTLEKASKVQKLKEEEKKSSSTTKEQPHRSIFD